MFQCNWNHLLEERSLFSAVSRYIPRHIKVNLFLKGSHTHDLTKFIIVSLELIAISSNHNSSQTLMTLTDHTLLKELKRTQKANLEFSKQLQIFLLHFDNRNMRINLELALQDDSNCFFTSYFFRSLAMYNIKKLCQPVLQHFVPNLILCQCHTKFLVIMINRMIVLNGYDSYSTLCNRLYRCCSILDSCQKLEVSNEHRGCNLDQNLIDAYSRLSLFNIVKVLIEFSLLEEGPSSRQVLQRNREHIKHYYIYQKQEAELTLCNLFFLIKLKAEPFSMRSVRNNSLRDRLFKNNIQENAASSALQEESEKQTCELLHLCSVSHKLNNQIKLNNERLSTWEELHPQQDKSLQLSSTKLCNNFQLKRNIRVKKVRAEKTLMDESLEYKKRLNDFDSRPIFSISLLSPQIDEKQEKVMKKIGQKRLRSKTIKAYLAYSSIPQAQLSTSNNGERDINKVRMNNLGSQMDRRTEKVSRQVTFISTLQLNNSVSFETFMKSIKQNKHITKNTVAKPSSTQAINHSRIFKKNRGESLSFQQKRKEIKTQISLKKPIDKIFPRSPQFKKIQHLLSLEK